MGGRAISQKKVLMAPTACVAALTRNWEAAGRWMRLRASTTLSCRLRRCPCFGTQWSLIHMQSPLHQKSLVAPRENWPCSLHGQEAQLPARWSPQLTLPLSKVMFLQRASLLLLSASASSGGSGGSHGEKQLRTLCAWILVPRPMSGNSKLRWCMQETVACCMWRREAVRQRRWALLVGSMRAKSHVGPPKEALGSENLSLGPIKIPLLPYCSEGA